MFPNLYRICKNHQILLPQPYLNFIPKTDGRKKQCIRNSLFTLHDGNHHTSHTGRIIIVIVRLGPSNIIYDILKQSLLDEKPKNHMYIYIYPFYHSVFHPHHNNFVTFFDWTCCWNIPRRKLAWRFIYTRPFVMCSCKEIWFSWANILRCYVTA